MNITDARKYLYYRIYSWNLRTWGENDVPQFNALVGVSFLVYLNILTLFVAIELITGVRILKEVGFNKIHVGMALILIDVIDYFTFLYKGKYKKIKNNLAKKMKLKEKEDLFGVFYTSFLVL